MKRTACVCLSSLVLCATAFAQEEAPELTGSLPFHVSSQSGRVERLMVSIGDGGTGTYKAVLTGEPGLPTHAIYRPRDLRPFGPKNPLPVVAFANGGCRNTSGEFRNMLSELASQGFVVIAIGPAGNAVVMGGEERTNMSAAAGLLDGVSWAIAENARAGSAFYQKIDISKIAVAGQSCGAAQAIEAAADPRVTTTIAFNQGINLGAPFAGRGGAGRGPAAPADKRYAPYAPILVRAPEDAGGTPVTPRPNGAEALAKVHGPILFLSGGVSDSGHKTATANYDAIDKVMAVHAYEDVGHYPGTYREDNGGAFARVAGAWLKWQLRGDAAAGKMFAGAACGLCTDAKWTIDRKNMEPAKGTK